MAEDMWGFRSGSGPFRAPRELDEMRRRFEDDVVRPVMRAVWERIPEEVKGWSPAVDVLERGETVIVRIEIPGVKKEDIDLSVSDEAMVISGQRNPEAGVEDSDFSRREMHYGSFYRSVSLPANVETHDIGAVYRDGVLEVTLHLAAAPKARKIDIQVK
jgi:HSP20 family protein